MTETPPPDARRARAPSLETALLIVGLIAGTIVGIKAFTGGLEPAKISLAGSPATSSPAPAGPSPTDSESPSGNVFFSAANSNLVQGSDPCKIELRFHWTPAPESSVPVGATAVIVTSGPGLKDGYNRPVTSSGIDLRIPVTVKGSARWTATVASIGGRTADATPLELTVSGDFC
ncbi:MAG: hypothetical protein ACRDKS_04605 [Actinomycetota bacterium]